jgi:hypothetical protein
VTGAFNKLKITTRAVEALKPGETLADSELPGYFVRRQKGEARTYFVRKHVRGQRQFVTIGEHGREGWTEHKARAEALMIIASLRKGDDPSADRAKRRSMPTVAEYAASYLENHCSALKQEQSKIIEVCFELILHRRTATTQLVV